jgi:hypothetical protein
MSLPTAPQPAGDESPERDLRAMKGKWRLRDLEELVEGHAAGNPEQAQEWRTYLYYLRPFASSNGYLPKTFEAMVYEVFGELIGTAGPASR